jgi:hypothetical protein
MEKCYSVTIQQTLKRTLTLPIPKSGLTQKEIEEVLSKMNFGNYFDPVSRQETSYGDILDTKSEKYEVNVEDDEHETYQYEIERKDKNYFSECCVDFCNDFENTYENKLLPAQPNQSSNL